MDNIFTFYPGRTQFFQAKDMFAIGLEKLGQTNHIRDFIARTSGVPLKRDPAGTDEEETAGVEMHEIDDEALDDFDGPNDLLQ